MHTILHFSNIYYVNLKPEKIDTGRLKQNIC